jgi:hypothetical protein
VCGVWTIGIVDLDVQVEFVQDGFGRDGGHLFSIFEVAEVRRVCSVTGAGLGWSVDLPRARHRLLISGSF